MTILAWLGLVVVAQASCVADSDSSDYPVLPGGGTGLLGVSGSGSSPGTGSNGSDSVFRGRVCRITNVTDLSTCSTIGVAGLTVSIGGVTARTAADGTFEIPEPRGSLLAFRVAGPGAVTTTTPFSPSTTVPVVDADVFARALRSNEIFLPPGSGTILGTLVRNGLPASGMQVASTPTSAFAPLFDTTTGLGLDATGSRGVFLVPGITAGPASLTFSPGETLVAGIPVVNGGITILDSVALP